ncbi:protein translocase subunit SecD [Rhodoluna sp.]|uniref:protein translocase subunit SecD n=1 Tax=Rhodoluna sp. TaxID=1969481 RepID=UPI0025FF97C1|nr:protein translocase subunit SecD [Rhodoluna sp.]
MSDSSVTKSARKRLTWLGVLIVGLAGIIGLGSVTNAGASFAPKLALDLQGGTQIILAPLLEDGKTVTEQQLSQAVAIIRQRVDASGVSEASVKTQGNNNIIVEIPGVPDENTLKLIRSSAKLEFRPVLQSSQSASATVGASPSPSTSAAPVAPPTGTTQQIFDKLDCSTAFRTPGQVDDPTKELVTCDVNGYEKFVLGPVEIEGSDISDANAGTVTSSTGASTNTWAVNLDFNDAGTKKFADVTSRLYPQKEPLNRFAVTLDGYVIVAPTTNAVISNGSAQITGSFDKDSSKSLADQLKYGSLPIGFEVQSQENISATLGSEQLSSGLLAGAIGLLLVVIYSLFQYRGLAVVTIGSLVVAAILVYLFISLLAWRQGYRLSLAGVAGLIVAIGITADSFIVYFERVRDEIRDGRTLGAAVDQGWKRAIRTILVSGGVSLLAAVVLYALTVGNVRGFAFTLGLTTLVDLGVAMIFTHPILQLLAKTRFFSSGHPWSGFDSKALGAAGYVGRGQFRTSASLSAAKVAKASKEANKRQTIAERKAAQANSANKAGENN